MTDEETRRYLLLAMRKMCDVCLEVKRWFLALNKRQQLVVAGGMSAGVLAASLMLSTSQDYSDPRKFFEKVAEDELIRRADFYNEYAIEEIEVLSAEVCDEEGCTERVSAQLRFVPRSGTVYYRWENNYTQELWWGGVYPADPYDKVFAKEVESARQAVKDWNAYKVGLFRKISEEDRNKLLNIKASAFRRKVDGKYVLDDSGWDPFNSLDFTYYYTQDTAWKRDNCPALLCDKNGPESKDGKRFSESYQHVLQCFVAVRDELDEACRLLKKDDSASADRFRKALETFTKVVGSMPRLGNK